MYIKKRWLIIALSFLIGAILVLSGFVLMLFCEKEGNKTTMSYPQKENIITLAESLEQIDYSLKKGSYANTPYQAVVLASNVLLETGSAKEDLQHLPIYDLALEKTAKYLSQTGEFVFWLAEKAVKGEEITDQDRQTLEELSKKATELATELRAFSAEVTDQNYGHDDLLSLFSSKKTATAAVGGESSDGNIFERIEDSFKDFSAVYYDGKFSDKIQKEIDKFWQDIEEISAEKAKEIACYIMDLSDESVIFEGQTEQQNTICYRFSGLKGEKEALITKQGGFLYGYNSTENVGDATLSNDDAISFAQKFFEKLGFSGLTLVKSVYNGNILTLTYATKKDNVIIYPEEITISIALDNGKIVSFVADKYWQNIKQNRTFGATLSPEEASENLSDNLMIKEVNKAFALSEGENEFACYEFICQGQNEEEVRVYINSKSGVEEKIVLVTENDEGIFFN